MIGVQAPNVTGIEVGTLPPRPESGSPPALGRLRSWSARRPVTAFLVLAAVLAGPVMALPVLADHGVIASGWMPQVTGVDTERVASLLLVFAALLPAAVWVTWAADGPDGVRRLARRLVSWRFGPGWWVLALFALPMLTLVIGLALGDTFRPVDVAPFVAAQVTGLLVNLLLVNIWEEAAWSGLVQTRLQQRHGLVRAALLTAVPFALAHLPLHFIGDFSWRSVLSALMALVIVCALVRLMIGVFLRHTHGSILAVAVLHSVFNRSNNEEGLVAGLLEGDGRKLAGLIAVLLLTVTVAVVTRRTRRSGGAV